MSLKRLLYKTLYCTTSEDYYGLNSLSDFDVVEGNEENEPESTKGWDSPLFPDYPISFIIELLDGEMCVKEIHITPRYSGIPRKIEIYAARGGSLSSLTEFSKIGTMKLEERDTVQSHREGSMNIYPNAVAKYLKFIMSEPLEDPTNNTRQVGISTLKVFGEPHIADRTLRPLKMIHLIESVLYNLKTLKEEAIESEQYMLAKKLTQIVKLVENFAEEASLLEARKKEAIVKEDFDTANEIKEIMASHKSTLRDTINQQGLELFDEELNIIESQKQRLLVSGLTNDIKTTVGQTLKTPTSVGDYELPIKSNANSSFGKDSVITYDAENTTLRAGKSGRDISPNLTDDRPLPALEKLRLDVEPKDPSLDVSLEPDDSITSLSNVQLSDLAEIADILGQKVALCLFSKQFSRKEWAINQVMEFLNNDDLDSRDLERACCWILKRIVTDTRERMFTLTLDLYKTFLKRFVRPQQPINDVARLVVEDTLSELIGKAGGQNPRIKSAAIQFVRWLTEFYPPFISSIYLSILHPQKYPVAPRGFLAKLELALELLYSANFSGIGIDFQSVAIFALSAMEQSHKEVREAGFNLLNKLYEFMGASLPQFISGTKYSHLLDELNFGVEDLSKPARINAMHFQKSPTEDSPSKRKYHYRDHNDTSPFRQEYFPKSESLSFTNPLPSQSIEKLPNSVNSIAASSSPIRLSPPKSLSDLNKICLFCGRQDESFNEESLDLHYWKECPMLTNCPLCRQIVEIADLTTHLLEECIHSQMVKKCPRCHECVSENGFEDHLQLSMCREAKLPDEASRCPLCHNDILPGEKGWKIHLLQSPACPAHPRIVRKSLG